MANTAHPPPFYPVTTPGAGVGGVSNDIYNSNSSNMHTHYAQPPGGGVPGGAYPGYNPQGIGAAPNAMNNAPDNAMNSEGNPNGVISPVHGGGMAAAAPQQPKPQPPRPSSTGLIRLTLRKPMGIVFEPMPVQTGPGGVVTKGNNTGVRICDLPRTGAAALSRKLEVGDELLAINDVTMSRLSFDEIMDFIIAADPDCVNLLFRRPRKDVPGPGGPIPASAASMQPAGMSNATNSNAAGGTATVTWVDERTSRTRVDNRSDDGDVSTLGGASSQPPSKSGRANARRRANNPNSNPNNNSKKQDSKKQAPPPKERDKDLASESFLDMLIDSLCSFNSPTAPSPNTGKKSLDKKDKRYYDDDSRYSRDDNTYDDSRYDDDDYSRHTYDDDDGTYNSESQFEPSIVSDDYAKRRNNKNDKSKPSKNDKDKGGKDGLGRNSRNARGRGRSRDDESYTVDDNEDDYTLETMDTNDRPGNSSRQRNRRRGGRGRSNDDETETYTESEFTREDTAGETDDDQNVPLGLAPKSKRDRFHKNRQEAAMNPPEHAHAAPHGAGPGAGGHAPEENLLGNEDTPSASVEPNNLPFAELEYAQDNGDGADVSVLTNNMSQYGSTHVSPAALMHAYNYVPEPGRNLEESIQNNPERFYRHVVRELLSQNEPEKIRLLDKLLAKYAGREEHLIQKLSLRYRENNAESAGGASAGAGAGTAAASLTGFISERGQDSTQEDGADGLRHSSSHGDWTKTPTIQEDQSYEGETPEGTGNGAVGSRPNAPGKPTTPASASGRPTTPANAPAEQNASTSPFTAYQSLSSYASPDSTTKGTEKAFPKDGRRPDPAPAPAITASRSHKEEETNSNGLAMRSTSNEEVPTDDDARGRSSSRTRSRKGALVLSVSRSHSRAEEEVPKDFHDEDDEDDDEAKQGASEYEDDQDEEEQVYEVPPNANKDFEEEVVAPPSSTQVPSPTEEELIQPEQESKHAGGAKSPDDETIEVYQTEDDYSAPDSYSGTGSEYTETSDIDGTSPAVIAQVSELLNFVYGKTSVPGQIDRVSTIMRAYEGRENVLLELLETKALIKANAVNEPPPPGTGLTAASAGQGQEMEANNDDDISSVSGMSSKFNVKVPLESESVSPMVSPITQSVGGHGDVDSPQKFPEYRQQKENVPIENTPESSFRSSTKPPDKTQVKKKKGIISKIFGKKGKKKGSEQSMRERPQNGGGGKQKKGNVLDTEGEV